jgi:hypothetical protein
MTAAAAVKAPGGEAMLGRAVVPPPGRDPIETARFHNNSYANRVPNLQQEDGVPYGRSDDRSALFRSRPGPKEKHAPEPDSRSRKFDTHATAAIRRQRSSKKARPSTGSR